MNIVKNDCDLDEDSEELKRSPLSENPEDFADVIAELPEWQPHGDPWKEYRDWPEEKIWTPIPESSESRVPLFMFMARSALTCAQERQGVSNEQAMENSCSGYAEQHIYDVLHDSAYIPEVALRRLITKEVPDKLVDRWTPSEVVLFGKGLNLYGKKFTAIGSNLLPHKTTADLVEFYYTWKRLKEVKGLVASRARRFLRMRKKQTNLIIGSPKAPGMLTRGQLAAVENSGTPSGKVTTSRKHVYTGVKRKRRITRRTRHYLLRA